MIYFGLGILCGGVLAVLLLALVLRVLGGRQRTPSRRAVAEPTSERWGSQPDLTLMLSRDALTHLIAEGLRNLSVPLVTLRAPQVRLEPNALIQITVRGDTILLGGQMIVLRTRIVPAAVGVQVVTESAALGALGGVAGSLTSKLDERINAALTERLALAEQFEVLDIVGSDEAVTINARLRS